MSGDDQLPLEGLSGDAEPADKPQANPVPEPEPEQSIAANVSRRSAPEPLEAPAPSAVAEATDAAGDEQPLTSTAEESPVPQKLGPTPEPGSTDVETEHTDALVGEEPGNRPEPADAPKREGRVPDPTALYFLTNRMNLNGVLSSRLVAPRESHAKYYVDLLEQVPGWVPLLTNPPSLALIEAVTQERGAGTPVLIEFPLSVAKKSDLQNPAVYVPALALSQAVAIHFREERDLREHRARGYKNIHPHDDLLKVSPNLFASEVSGEVQLTPPASPPQLSWTRIDRVRGAINGALAAVENGEQLAVAAAFLGGVKFPASVVLPDWIGWRELDDTAGERMAPDPGVPDHVGFRSVYEVLGGQDATDAWSPNAVLDGVATRVREAGLEVDAVDALIRNLQRVRSIVNVEVDFEPFRSTARALVSAKALLLVLLRSDLEELLAWPEEQTGADDVTRVTAAVLAGRLRGLARESITLRSLALDDMTAAWAVRVARGEARALGKVQFSSSSRGTSLKLDGVELSSQDPLLPDLVAKYRKVVESKRESLRIAISRAVGWPVTHRLSLPSGADVSESEGVLTILTPAEVELTVSVDEREFVSKLDALVGSSKRRALSAFDLRRR